MKGRIQHAGVEHDRERHQGSPRIGSPGFRRVYLPIHQAGTRGRTVVAYAGPDAIAELADQALRDTKELGIEIPSDAAESYWPDWA